MFVMLRRYFEKLEVRRFNHILDGCLFEINEGEFKYSVLDSYIKLDDNIFSYMYYIKSIAEDKEFTLSYIHHLDSIYKRWAHKMLPKYIAVLKDNCIRKIIYIDYNDIEKTIAEIELAEYEINIIDKDLEKDVLYTKNGINKEKGN